MSQSDNHTSSGGNSGIIIALIALTLVLFVLVNSLRSTPSPATNPGAQQLTREGIAPVASVRVKNKVQTPAVDEAEPVRPTPVSAEPAAMKPAEDPVESSGPDGEKIYQSVCLACHMTGAAGAPKLGSDELAQRLADKGLDGLVNSAISGLNIMPPKGGRSDLSDEDIQAAVEFMLR